MYIILSVIYRTLITRLDSTCSISQLLIVWLQETYWGYGAMMTNVVDREVYRDCVSTTIKKYFCGHPLVRKIHVLYTCTCIIDNSIHVHVL